MKKSLIFILNCFSIFILKAGDQGTLPINYPAYGMPFAQVKPHAISAEVAKECEKQSNGEQDLENKCLCEKCWEETVCGNLAECRQICKCPDPRETGTWHS